MEVFILSETTQEEVFTFAYNKDGNRVFGIPIRSVEKTSYNTYLITTPSGCAISIETDADLIKLCEKDGRIVASEG